MRSLEYSLSDPVQCIIMAFPRRIAESLAVGAVAASRPFVAEPKPEGYWTFTFHKSNQFWLEEELRKHEKHRENFASIWTDDQAAKAEFNPDLWFQCATDEEIVSLARCGFRGDYPADSVGEWTAAIDSSVRLVLRRVEQLRDEQAQLGFEVCVDPEIALEWIRKHRPELHDRAREAYAGPKPNYSHLTDAQREKSGSKPSRRC